MKTVFIFGLGYVGVPLAQALADQGWQIRGATRTPSKLADKADQGWQILPFQSGQPLADPAAFFVQRGSRNFDGWQDRQRAFTTHSLTQSGFACRALWSECFDHKDVLEAAIAARKIAPQGVRLTHALPRHQFAAQRMGQPDAVRGDLARGNRSL